MKNTHYAAVLLLAAIFAAPFEAQALLKSEADVEANVTAEDTLKVETQGESKTEIKTSATESEETSNETTSDEVYEADLISATADVKAGALVIVRSNLVGEGSATTTPVPASVQSDADLKAYAEATVKADENVKDAELAPSHVSLRYKQRAKLLGFIPVSVYAKSTVKAEGEVEVKYPWYRFLLVKDEAKVKTTLETRTRAIVEANGSATAEFSARTQAMLFDNLRAVMKENLDAQIAVQAENETDVEIE